MLTLFKMRNIYCRIGHFCVCLFLIYTGLNAQAQSGSMSAESLERAFNGASSDTARLAILLKDSPNRYTDASDRSLALYKQGLSIAERLNDHRSKAHLLRNIGYIYRYSKLSVPEAIKWFQKSLAEAKAAGSDEECDFTSYAIGRVYDDEGNRNMMYEYLNKAIGYSEKLAKPYIGHFLALEFHYTEDNRLDEALAVGNKLMSMKQKTNFNQSEWFQIYGYLLRVLKRMQHKKEAYEYYKSKFLRFIEVDHINFINNIVDVDKTIYDLDNAAFFCIDIGRPDLAIPFAKQLLEVLKHSGNNEPKADAHQYLAEAYEALGNYRLSIDHYKKYAEARIDFVKGSLADEAGRKTVEVESEKALLKKQGEIEKERLRTILVFSIAVMAFLGFIFAFWFYKREQATKKALAALNSTKDRLFAILSHDLLSPIASLKNYTMLADWGAMSQTQFIDSTKSLQTKVNFLYSMLENLLHWSISQMGGFKPKAEQVEVAGVVIEQIALLSPTGYIKKIEVEQLIPNDFVVKVDKNHLRLIVRNLLQNALKFTPTGGKIVFEARVSGRVAELLVKDNGIGMSPEILSKLFRVDQDSHRSGTENEEGTGLGLILTRELVEMNGGSIMAESEAGKGTSFILSFPLVNNSE